MAASFVLSSKLQAQGTSFGLFIFFLPVELPSAWRCVSSVAEVELQTLWLSDRSSGTLRGYIVAAGTKFLCFNIKVENIFVSEILRGNMRM